MFEQRITKMRKQWLPDQVPAAMFGDLFALLRFKPDSAENL